MPYFLSFYRERVFQAQETVSNLGPAGFHGWQSSRFQSTKVEPGIQNRIRHKLPQFFEKEADSLRVEVTFGLIERSKCKIKVSGLGAATGGCVRDLTDDSGVFP
jgi:hypothetical protein